MPPTYPLARKTVRHSKGFWGLDRRNWRRKARTPPWLRVIRGERQRAFLAEKK
jgi:hypothetical protein